MKLSVKFPLPWSPRMLMPTDLIVLPAHASALFWDIFAPKVLVELGAANVPGAAKAALCRGGGCGSGAAFPSPQEWALTTTQT